MANVYARGVYERCLASGKLPQRAPAEQGFDGVRSYILVAQWCHLKSDHAADVILCLELLPSQPKDVFALEDGVLRLRNHHTHLV